MFFSHQEGAIFEPFNITHIITLLLFVGGLVLLFVFRDKLKNYKYEKQLRIIYALFLFVWEIGLYIFEVTSSAGWVWADHMPFISLCGIALYLTIILLLTKNYLLFEIVYFFTFGAIASLLFPDILYSFDRYRYYQFIIGHAGFFYGVMYMFFVHRFIPTFKSFIKSVITLGSLSIFFVIINPILGINALFLSESDGTPFEIFEGGSQFLYIVGVFVMAFCIMLIWFGMAKLFEKQLIKK